MEKESKTEEGANKENAGPSNIDDDAAVAATLAADADGPCEKCREHPLRNGRRCKPSIKEYTKINTRSIVYKRHLEMETSPVS